MEYRFLVLDRHDDLTLVYSIEDDKLFYLNDKGKYHVYTRIVGMMAKSLKEKHRLEIEEAKVEPKFTSHHGV